MLTAKEGLARADFSAILMPMLGGDRLLGLPSYPIRNQTVPVV